MIRREAYLTQVKADFPKHKKALAASLVTIFAGVGFGFLTRDAILAGVLVFIGTLWMMSVLLRSANVLMIKNVTLDKLAEGDWVIDTVKKAKRTLYDPKKSVAITQKDIDAMKGAGITHVRVMEGVPFVPSFFIALLVTLINPYSTLVVLTRLAV